MSVLFLLSNIAVPFLILGFTSLVQVHQNGSYLAAKWFILILYTFISNFLFYFLSDSSLYLVIDLIIKLGIVFIPEVVNQSLQKIIAAFHFELLIDQLRFYLLPKFQALYSSILLYVSSKMTPKQQQQFKTTILDALNRIDNPSAAPLVSSPPPEPVQVKKITRENTGVTCDLLTIAMLKSQMRQKELLRLQLSQKKIEPSSTYESTQNSKVKVDPRPEYVGGSMKKKSTFTIQKSNTDIEILEQQEKVTFSKADHKKPEPKKIKEEPVYDHRNNFKSPPKKQDLHKVEQEPSMILNKLDVSEYSDMFEDDEANPDKKLVIKVETIIQIAGINTSRLEIYNIELYSNNEIRIVSLYGRQFEKHTLISMKALKHGYYELKLEGGKVQSRKVKFRGSFEQFLKYLQSEV